MGRFSPARSKPSSALLRSNVKLDAAIRNSNSLCVPKTLSELNAPLSRTVKRAGRILCRPVLGGLHHEYVRI
jgi:hypothetical protein